MKKEYSIGTFSKKTGITVRTLHYYDEIGILKPVHVSDNGRRIYADESFITLQKIITLKHLGYSLEKIKEFLQSDRWDLKESLVIQKEMMLEQKKQIEKVINILDHAIYATDHETEVDASIFISLINGLQMENEHKQWLQHVLDEQLVEKMFNQQSNRQFEMEKEMVIISSELTKLYGCDPADNEVQTLIEGIVNMMIELICGDLSILESIATKDVPEEEWLFPSPFPPEIEEWVLKGIDINLRKRGIHLNGRSKEDEQS